MFNRHRLKGVFRVLTNFTDQLPCISKLQIYLLQAQKQLKVRWRDDEVWKKKIRRKLLEISTSSRKCWPHDPVSDWIFLCSDNIFHWALTVYFNSLHMHSVGLWRQLDDLCTHWSKTFELVSFLLRCSSSNEHINLLPESYHMFQNVLLRSSSWF